MGFGRGWEGLAGRLPGRVPSRGTHSGGRGKGEGKTIQSYLKATGLNSSDRVQLLNRCLSLQVSCVLKSKKLLHFAIVCDVSLRPAGFPREKYTEGNERSLIGVETVLKVNLQALTDRLGVLVVDQLKDEDPHQTWEVPSKFKYSLAVDGQVQKIPSNPPKNRLWPLGARIARSRRRRATSPTASLLH